MLFANVKLALEYASNLSCPKVSGRWHSGDIYQMAGMCNSGRGRGDVQYATLYFAHVSWTSAKALRNLRPTANCKCKSFACNTSIDASPLAVRTLCTTFFPHSSMGDIPKPQNQFTKLQSPWQLICELAFSSRQHLKYNQLEIT